MEQIHHDEETDFYVLAHSYDAARQTPPHDHGSSWAIYGQAAGYTDMTVWNLTGQLDDEGTRIVEPVKRFRLDPPCAGVFHPGEIHSIHFTQGGRTVRVTGTDLSTAGQARFSPRPDTA